MSEEKVFQSLEEKFKVIIAKKQLSDAKRRKLERPQGDGLETVLFSNLREVIEAQGEKLNGVNPEQFHFHVFGEKTEIKIEMNYHNLKVKIDLHQYWHNPIPGNPFNKSEIVVMYTANKLTSEKLQIAIDNDLNPLWKTKELKSNKEVSDHIFEWFFSEIEKDIDKE